MNTKMAHLVWVIGPFKKRWWMKPICFFKGHNPKVRHSYGIRYRQCERCGKSLFSGMLEKLKKGFYSGEVGSLYGIRFVTSNKKGVKKYEMESAEIF